MCFKREKRRDESIAVSICANRKNVVTHYFITKVIQAIELYLISISIGSNIMHKMILIRRGTGSIESIDTMIQERRKRKVFNH